ncbi:CHAT domain-containing protein [Catalinimonas sp. 4WD22]|uniref:CHAT domain-containing protein n=1 Tax=Catalinimonas locisalis TaxID=3133978 RepID=UPI0031011FF0
MKNLFQKLFIIISILCISFSLGFGQVMEWPEVFAGESSESPLHFMYMMGGEYDKAIVELDKVASEVAQNHGTNSLDYLNLQYHQWLSYHYTQQENKAAQIREEMQPQADKLPEDSLLKHLLYKSWLDIQLHSSLISGVNTNEVMSESDDPLLSSLGEVSVVDPQAYQRKMAAAFEITEKYEEQEEENNDQMALEMYGAMYGKEGASDLAELMKLAEEGGDLSDEEAIQQLLKMEDNSLISSYLPLLKGVQELDEGSSPEEALALAEDAERADTEAAIRGMNQLTTPVGYQAKKTISRQEFEEKMQRFDQLNEEEKVVLEDQLLDKLQQRDQIQGKIKWSSHGDVYIQLARFYEARGAINKSANFYRDYKDALTEILLLYQQGEPSPYGEEMEEEEDYASRDMQYLTAAENQIFIISAMLHNFVMRHHQQHPELASYAYNTALQDKGMLLEKKRNLRVSAQNSDNAYLHKIADQWLTCKKQKVHHDTEHPALEQQLDLLEKELSRNAQDLLQTDWKAIQQQLKEGEAAVEFIYFYNLPQDPSSNSQTTTSIKEIDSLRTYAAVLLVPEEVHPHFILLAQQFQLDRLLKIDSSNSPQQLYQARGASPVNKNLTGDELYQLVWEPLEPFLQNTQVVHFSPAGILHQVAFAALPHPEGLLLDRYDLRQLSSTRQITLQSSESSPQNAVLFGSIRYGTPPKSETNTQNGSSNSQEPFEYLPGTKGEIEAIANLVEDQGIASELFTEAEASEEAVSQLVSPSILHIATHGFFKDSKDSTDAPTSEDELILDDQLSKSKEQQDTLLLEDEAMLLSGLAFADANRNWKDREQPVKADDGILLATEAAQLDLHQTQLVVLSACETGLGLVRGSEGVYGLQRALREAGAQKIIMSLWSVPDLETQEMMQLFYQFYLQEKLTIRKAFRKAQQQMREKYDPYQWAAFTLVE